MSSLRHSVKSLPPGRSRTLLRSVLAVETPEGAGAVVRRSIGTQTLRNFDPFLMLDHFVVGKGAGFPDHPHRGQATVTYMLDGQFRHEDFAGHKGLISAGDLQWMIAGKGIVHAEMPVHDPSGGPDPTGLQLWIDLPKIHKMVPPQYQELKDDQIPRVELEDTGATVKVISGSSHGIESPVRHLGGCWYFDIRLPRPSSRVFQAIPKGWNAFIYGLEGRARFGTEASDNKTTADAYYTTVLTANDEEEGVEITNVDPNEGPVRLVLIAGEPLNQPVVQYGPFVMTSKAEIQQAFEDYRHGKNGFEKAAEWVSTIGGR